MINNHLRDVNFIFGCVLVCKYTCACGVINVTLASVTVLRYKKVINDVY